eukprot:3577887-Heterocapsa_arctica.AAC.1
MQPGAHAGSTLDIGSHPEATSPTGVEPNLEAWVISEEETATRPREEEGNPEHNLIPEVVETQHQDIW